MSNPYKNWHQNGEISLVISELAGKSASFFWRSDGPARVKSAFDDLAIKLSERLKNTQ